MLARDGQTQIVSMQCVNECGYRIATGVNIVLEQIFLNGGA